jgi:hypothetical protein
MASASILLGFLSKHKPAEFVIATALLSCIPILLIVLYRIFNKRYPKELAERYNTRTMLLFVVGISIPFATILVAMFEGC